MINILRLLAAPGCFVAAALVLVSCTRGPESNEAQVPDYTVPLSVGGKTVRAVPLLTPEEQAGGPGKTEEQLRRMAFTAADDAAAGKTVYVGVFPRTEPQAISDFRGALEPLDVAFLGEDGNVISLQHQPPSSVTQTRVPFTLHSGKPARFALWAPAGRLVEIGVRLGVKVSIPPRLKDMRVVQFRAIVQTEGQGVSLNSELLNLQVLDTPRLRKNALRNLGVRPPGDPGGENPLVLAVHDNFGRAIVRREDEPMPKMQPVADGEKTTAELWYVVRIRAKSGKREDATYQFVIGGIIPPGANPAEITGLAPAGWRICFIMEKGAGRDLGLQPDLGLSRTALLPLLSYGRVRRNIVVKGKDGDARLDVEVARTEEERLAFPWSRFSFKPSEGLLFPLTRESNNMVRVTDFLLPTLRASASLAFIDMDGVIRVVHDVEPEPWPLVHRLAPRGYYRRSWADRWSAQRPSLEKKLTGYDSKGKFVRYALLAAPGWFKKHGIVADGASRMEIDGGLRVPATDIEPWRPKPKEKNTPDLSSLTRRSLR